MANTERPDQKINLTINTRVSRYFGIKKSAIDQKQQTSELGLKRL